MFELHDGKIVIMGESALLSVVYTPDEWNAEMLRLLDERQMALNNKAIVNAESKRVEVFPARPDLPTIWGHMEWKAETEKVIAVADKNAAQGKTLRDEITKLEARIIQLMPENTKLLIIDAEKPGAYSVWWTSRYDIGSDKQRDLRVEALTNQPSAPVVPMSKQLSPASGDMAF